MDLWASVEKLSGSLWELITSRFLAANVRSRITSTLVRARGLFSGDLVAAKAYSRRTRTELPSVLKKDLNKVTGLTDQLMQLSGRGALASSHGFCGS